MLCLILPRFVSRHSSDLFWHLFYPWYVRMRFADVCGDGFSSFRSRFSRYCVLHCPFMGTFTVSADIPVYIPSVLVYLRPFVLP